MSFYAHIEYLFHITCSDCKFYWTYASMEKNFITKKRDFHSPNCGQKNRIRLEDDIKRFTRGAINQRVAELRKIGAFGQVSAAQRHLDNQDVG